MHNGVLWNLSWYDSCTRMLFVSVATPYYFLIVLQFFSPKSNNVAGSLKRRTWKQVLRLETLWWWQTLRNISPRGASKLFLFVFFLVGCFFVNKRGGRFGWRPFDVLSIEVDRLNTVNRFKLIILANCSVQGNVSNISLLHF